MEVFLGIDVSKGYADFLLMDGSFSELGGTVQLDDTRQGHSALAGWLSETVRRHGVTQVNAAVESTGGFEDNWMAMLSGLSAELPVRVARLNPSVVKNSAKADLKLQVTDALSAHNIASYLVRYGDRVRYGEADGRYRAFRSLQNHIDLLTRQRSRMQSELKQLLYTCFPGLQRHCRQGVPDWVLRMLRQYPTAGRLARAKASKVARIKGISAIRAVQLIEMAKESVGARGDLTDEFLIESMAHDLLIGQDRIAALKKHLGENCRGPEVELLQSIKGIGAYSAACIMTQIEDIARFPSPAHLAGYFGLHPTIRQSGDRRQVSRMSKKGRPALRAVLFMCANSAVLHDPLLKAIYHRHRERGKAHKQAIGAVMHKMLRIVWGVLTSGRPYDPEIDRRNREKGETARSVENTDEDKAKRRLQPFDETAPVSRMAMKKRKAHLSSQVGTAEQVRDLQGAPQGQT